MEGAAAGVRTKAAPAGVVAEAAAAAAPRLRPPRPPRPRPRLLANLSVTALSALSATWEASRLLLRASPASASRAASAHEKLLAGAAVVAVAATPPASSTTSHVLSPAPTTSASSMERDKKVAEAWRARKRRAERARASSGLARKEGVEAAAAVGGDNEGNIFFANALSGLGFFETELPKRPLFDRGGDVGGVSGSVARAGEAGF